MANDTKLDISTNGIHYFHKFIPNYTSPEISLNEPLLTKQKSPLCDIH
ncbi:hypothetical protein C7475_101648 [Chitinophaga sp. S165]|nr:hypothetical protein C7475_101648 [Chitinophaga sp. S165]